MIDRTKLAKDNDRAVLTRAAIRARLRALAQKRRIESRAARRQAA